MVTLQYLNVKFKVPNTISYITSTGYGSDEDVLGGLVSFPVTIIEKDIFVPNGLTVEVEDVILRELGTLVAEQMKGLVDYGVKRHDAGGTTYNVTLPVINISEEGTKFDALR